MKRFMTLLTILFFTLSAHAQYKVTFIVKEKTAIHHDSIYLTGSFRNWDSVANPRYLMKPYGKNEKYITLDLPKGTISYKFNRGSWLTVEKEYNGGEVPNRVIIIHQDTTLLDSVEAWRDQMIMDKEYALTQKIPDTTRVKILTVISQIYAFYPEWFNADSALYYANETLNLTQKIKRSSESGSSHSNYSLFIAREVTAYLFHSLGNYPKSLELRFENLKMAEQRKNAAPLIAAMGNITDDYMSMEDYRKVLYYGKLIDSIVNRFPPKSRMYEGNESYSKSVIATAYYHLHMLDSALYYAEKITKKILFVNPYFSKDVLLGDIYSEKGEDSLAFSFYRRAVPYTLSAKYNEQLAHIHEGMARLFQKEGRQDSALYYAKLSLAYFQNNREEVRAWGENADNYVATIMPLISKIYEAKGESDSAYKYLNLSVNLRDSLYNMSTIWQFQAITFNEAAHRRQIELAKAEARQRYETRLKFYILAGIIIIILVITFLLFRNNRNKQKAYDLLKKQKKETDQQKEKAESTLQELRSAQKQLIQSEKMASLGELTAGIAHEIQNPLNFVNNFSEVSVELAHELKEDIGRLKMPEEEKANIESSINDIVQNQEKINFHGKRADAIVKSMLQHTRGSSGQKQLTDVNALADEYLRLSYHGLRAKDKSFNATIKTDFDETIGKINIVPQDIGRVLLNLYNNAFYAAPLLSQGEIKGPDDPHVPTVWVSTKREGSEVIIGVRDNGPGIADAIKDKIFQPFFTTKPTGEGTGLGLSLSYDIIKAHDGEIKVETKEGEGTEFIVILPITTGI